MTGRRLLVLSFIAALPLVTTQIRASDEIEYFAYLRSLAFDGDLEFGNEYQHFYDLSPQTHHNFKSTFLDAREPLTGRHFNFGPIGSAILWSPFYGVAHLGVVAARAAGSSVAADGYSKPYVAAVCYGSAILTFLGLLLVHDALTRFGGFSDAAASSSVAAMWLATPVLYYMSVAPGFSHAPSLFAVSLLLWMTLRVRSAGEGSVAAWAAIGAAGGLCGLVREQDALFLAVPALELAVQTLRRRSLAWGAPRAIALGAAAFVAFTPQLAAYKILTGAFGPSRGIAQKLDYSSPYFFDVLLHPGHGLYFWSPILLLATAGLAIEIARRSETAAMLAIAVLLEAWLCGSYQTWSQAGAFGARRFLSATLVFGWGLAAFVTATENRLGRRSVVVGLAFFVWWNVSLMVQFGLKLMDRQRLEWPRVAVNQIFEVPSLAGHTAWLYFTDPERLVRESR